MTRHASDGLTDYEANEGRLSPVAWMIRTARDSCWSLHKYQVEAEQKLEVLNASRLSECQPFRIVPLFEYVWERLAWLESQIIPDSETGAVTLSATNDPVRIVSLFLGEAPLPIGVGSTLGEAIDVARIAFARQEAL